MNSSDANVGVKRPARRFSGKAVMIALIVSWLAVTAYVVWVVAAFKRGGVDALRVDKPAAATSPASP